MSRKTRKSFAARITGEVSLFSAVLCMLILPAFSQGADVVRVKYEPGQSIREISRKYLGDADLWPYILTENGLERVDNIVPGQELIIPVKAIKDAHSAVEKANESIKKAADAGARILASDKLQKAIQLTGKAKESRQNGKWKNALAEASEATRFAEEAIRICQEQSNVPSQAEIKYRRGQVDKRSTSDNTWLDAPEETKLIEGDRVRTLSRSLANILFRDNSRLRLEENSQALIEKMRSNRLSKKEKSSVKLLQGDFLALLGGNQKDFKVEIKDVQTEFNSSRYRISKETDETKFSNYEGNIAISSAGKTVVIEENQGSVVKTNRPPTDPTNLLPKPVLLQPETDSRINPANTILAWASVEGASMYLVEVARANNYDDLYLNEKVLETRLPLPEKMKVGLYSWRVSAIDMLGLVGPPSGSRSMYVVQDDVAPFLTLVSPVDKAEVYTEQISIEGDTESDATLLINGKSYPIDSQGHFKHSVSLNPGQNEIKILVSDKAENITERVISVLYREENSIPVKFDSSMVQSATGEFLVRQPLFTLSATTVPNAEITLLTSSGVTSGRTVTGEDGRIHLTTPIMGEKQEMTLSVVSKSGKKQEFPVTVIVDSTPPEILLSAVIPKLTNDKDLTIQGKLVGGDTLLLNDKMIPVGEDQTFETNLTLKPGKQRVKFVAYDLVNNVSIIERSVTLDNQPPVVRKTTILPERVNGGGSVKIEILAEDASGLKRVGKFNLSVGDFKTSGILMLGTDGIFTATVNVPGSITGNCKLESLVLEDRAGNAWTQ